MSPHLIFLFLFQGGLAFAFSYFIVRVLLGGSDPAGRENILKGMKTIRKLLIVCTLILPAAMFAAYFKSLPEDASISLAVWPAVWIFVIMAALIAAMSMAMNRPDK